MPDLSNGTNRTKNQSNPIELQSFDWVRQSNKIEHLFCCEFDFRTNRTNIIEHNQTNPMQLSLDASHWVKHVEYNHCQLLLNNQELNIIHHAVSSLSSVFDISDFSVLGFSAQQKPRKKGRELAVISLSPSEFSNTTCLSCDVAFVN